MKRHRPNPLQRLRIAFLSAARNIAVPSMHAAFARDADAIPLTFAERCPGSRKGTMARLGRAALRRLPDMEADEFADTVVLLRGCADALDGDFRVTNETWLGQRRRADTHAA